jgi:hypothetical protein
MNLLKGVSEYQLEVIKAQVLDREFIDNLKPDKTCVSISSVEKIDIDTEKLISQAIESVEALKVYHLKSEYGQKEKFGEYSLFDNIGKFTTGFILKSYYFDKVNNTDEDIFLRLWFTPISQKIEYKKHIQNVGSKCDSGWY